MACLALALIFGGFARASLFCAGGWLCFPILLSRHDLKCKVSFVPLFRFLFQSRSFHSKFEYLFCTFFCPNPLSSLFNFANCNLSCAHSRPTNNYHLNHSKPWPKPPNYIAGPNLITIFNLARKKEKSSQQISDSNPALHQKAPNQIWPARQKSSRQKLLFTVRMFSLSVSLDMKSAERTLCMSKVCTSLKISCQKSGTHSNKLPEQKRRGKKSRQKRRNKKEWRWKMLCSTLLIRNLAHFHVPPLEGGFNFAARWRWLRCGWSLSWRKINPLRNRGACVLRRARGGFRRAHQRCAETCNFFERQVPRPTNGKRAAKVELEGTDVYSVVWTELSGIDPPRGGARGARHAGGTVCKVCSLMASLPQPLLGRVSTPSMELYCLSYVIPLHPRLDQSFTPAKKLPSRWNSSPTKSSGQPMFRTLQRLLSLVDFGLDEAINTSQFRTATK